MDRMDRGTSAVDRLAEAVRAATPSAILPAPLARVDDAQVDDGRLRVLLTIDACAYEYRWPEDNGAIADVLAASPAEHPPATWATTVLANLAETLEATDRGLPWAIEHRIIRAL